MTAGIVEEEIARILREELLLGSSRPIPPDAPLGELGLAFDSLALLNAVIAIEEAFGVQLPDDVLTSSGTLTVSKLALLVSETPRVPSRGVDERLRDSAVPPRHHRMERLEHSLASRGYVGRVLWAAARLAWPVKQLLFERPRYVLIEQPLEVDSAPATPPPGIEVRSYVPADDQLLAGLWPNFMERSSRRMVARLLDEGAIPLVATDGKRIVALDLLSRDGARGEIVLRPARDACWGLYLVEAPDFRGRGIGVALIAHSLRVSRELGCRTQLAAVRADNKPMLAACVQLLGFQAIGHAQRRRLLGFTRWSWEIDGKRSRGRRLEI
jgi:acyl carrier protein/GNAT superfamily N-acetyltransferase